MSSWKKQDEIEYTRCDLCGSNNTELYHLAKSLYGDRSFNVVRCTECGLIYVNRRPANKEWFVRYHSSAYALTANPQDTFERPSIERSYILAKLRLRQIRKFLPQGRILDFGCGNGVFVYTALSEGWDAFGIDLNEGLIQAANRYWKGYPLGKGWKSARMNFGGRLAETARAPRKRPRLFAASPKAFARDHPQSFDLINSSQVLEHLVSPSRTVAQLVTMIKSNGWFIADVPNARCWKEVMKRGSALNPTAHLHYFDRSTFQRLLEDQGLEAISIATRISLFGIWMRIMTPLGLKRIVPPLAHSMRFIPGLGLGTDLLAVARKKPNIKNQKSNIHM